MSNESEKKIRQDFLKKITVHEVDGLKQTEQRPRKIPKIPDNFSNTISLEESPADTNMNMVDVIEASSRALKIISEQKRILGSNAEKAIEQLRHKIKLLRADIDNLNSKIEDELNISSSLRQELQLSLDQNTTKSNLIAQLEGSVAELEQSNILLTTELNETKNELENSKLELSNAAEFFKTLKLEIDSKLMLALEEANDMMSDDAARFDVDVD